MPRAVVRRCRSLPEMADSATERRIRGVRHVDQPPIVRRIRQRTASGVARRSDISHASTRRRSRHRLVPARAVRDRFFAEYSGLQSFTQTVIRRSIGANHRDASPPGHAQAARPAPRNGSAAVREASKRPWRFDYFFTVLRQIERVHRTAPPSASLLLRFAMSWGAAWADPFMAFPASHLARVQQGCGRRQAAQDLRQYMGCSGPAGRAATATNEEPSLHSRQ